MKYKAFISYRHTDRSRGHAVSLERAIKRYARPLYKPPIAVFRDEQILRPGDDLPSGIRRALEQSEFLLYLATREAAESDWVADELVTWCRDLGRTDRLVILHVADEIGVDAEAQRLDWNRTDALPRALEPYLESLPIYADLSWAASDAERDLGNTRYKAAINRLVARIRGVTPESMMGHEVMTHRRNVRLRNAGIGVVALFAIAAATAAVLANQARRQEKAQRELAFARQLAAESQLLALQSAGTLPLSRLLAVESMRRRPTLAGSQALVAGLALAPRLVEVVAHDNVAYAQAFSPNGDLLVTGSSDGTVQVNEIPSAKERYRFEHGRPVRAVAVSGDGTRFVIAASDSTAKIVDLASGELISTVQQSGHISDVSMSHNGEWVATASTDTATQVWHATTGREAFAVEGAGFARVAFLGEENVMATVHRNSVRLRTLPTGTEITRIDYPHDLMGFAFAPEHDLVALGSWQGTVHVTKITTGNDVFIHRFDSPVRAVDLGRGGDWVAAGTWDGEVRVWDIATGALVFEGQHNAINTIGVSPNSRWISTGSSGPESTAQVWSLESGRLLARIFLGSEGNRVAFHPTRPWIASGSADGTAQVLEIPTDNVRNPVDGFSGHHLSPDATKLAAGNLLSAGGVWDLESGDQLLTVPNMSWFGDVAFDAAGSRLAVTGADGTARVISVETGDEIFRVAQADSGSWRGSVALSDDGLTLAAGGQDDVARVYDLSTGRELAAMQHEGFVSHVALHGRQFLAAAGGVVTVWDLAKAEEVMTFSTDLLTDALAFSPDGRLLASDGTDGTLRIYSVESRELVSAMNHGGSAGSLAFTADGAWLASGGSDGTARVWRVSDGQELWRSVLGAQIEAVAFAADQKWLVTVNEAGETTRSLWRPEDLIAEACARLSRNMSRAEWTQYFGVEEYQATCTF